MQILEEIIPYGTQYSCLKILSILGTTLVCGSSISTLYFMKPKSSVSSEYWN